ncbi:YwpF-like family protein [Cytobacillus spongiae]|jgi:hypothetical protein|uniref:YwpF-like family protein n=1 Tax=Cytobacillus spongiae TaxID=2901381 RepID=UPI001F3EF59D|nr:YwpF-like family protein [Cytobacillus spongiae]UII55702.1 YwpF-like family protein [Cytobacillus spongiae]
MKTFKLVSLQIIEDESLTDLDLTDALIINKEDDKSTWLIEAYINKSYFAYFNEAQAKKKEVTVQAIITKRENDPASFLMNVSSVKQLEEHISVLFEGHLKKSRSDYAELLLDELLRKGLNGEELLQEFKEKMKSKPRLVAGKK